MNMDLMRSLTVRPVWETQILGLPLTLTNASISMLAACLLMVVVLRLLLRNPQLVPGHGQWLVEAYYCFIRNVVHHNISQAADRFVPALFTLFTLILGCNLIGLMPGTFGPTTQIVITATLAVAVFVYAIGLRIRVHGWGLFRTFAPRGMPMFVLPLIVPIEMLSFLARPVTLAVRLFANMTAGHMALAVLAVLGWSAPWAIKWLPLGFSMIQIGMEFIIAVIQAYIFIILSCVYIDDALVGH